MASLEKYRKKRDFGATPEPEARILEAGGDTLSFVVQKHDARRLHYDFRLEWQGVLLSWAVTKGPSTDPSEKRLAVRTEDHPVDYGGFEGVIPEGNYGAGAVMLWDQGWWEPLHDPAKGLDDGKLHFRLHGARMTGGWVLVRMRGNRTSDKGRENWLLIKERDDKAGHSADALLKKHRVSVTTGRKMADIAADRQGRKQPAHGKPLPRFRKLELATLRDEPPEGDGWLHEAKFDGYRCVIAIGKGGVRLYTRNGKDWTDRFGVLCDAAGAIDCQAALIDGEVIAGQGGGDFSTLQRALKSGGELTFYAFDCLHLDGDDLTGKSLTERRRKLEKLLSGMPPKGEIRLSPIIEGSGAEVLKAICKAGGEGIVSKRADARYLGGRGTRWIKTKCERRAEFVLCGWSRSDKKGRAFSSLILGSYERGELRYRGRVGTGFDKADFAELQSAMKSLSRKTSPFRDVPSEIRSGARWVTPSLVVEVKYAELTADGIIRHGVYVALREDKPAMSVSAKAEENEAVRIGGVRITHPQRVVYPEAKLTKVDVAKHYEKVAARFLEHAGRRPVSLLRCPDGTSAECFFQKHAGKGFPDAIKALPIEESSGEAADYMVVSTPEGVLGAVQMGTIEFHIWGSAADRLEKPDRLVFDLDPAEDLDFAEVKKAATDIRKALDAIGLPTVPMVTGGKGVHVIVPLRRTAEWDTVKTFAQTFATAMADREPDRYVATMSKAKRKGKVFIDWLRNERGATAIAPYSLRAREGAAIAVPVTWDELDGLDSASGFHVDDMSRRLDRDCPLSVAQADAKGIGNAVVDGLQKWIDAD